uniref:Uncharacterized protein n=1 Tax=Ciona savignyi TaxID=51511 RepID=H2ZFB0_CIOSA
MLDIEKDQLAAFLQRESSAFRDILYHHAASGFEKSDNGILGPQSPQNIFNQQGDGWSRYAQGGKQTHAIQEGGIPVNARQHWSYEYMPGGRRSSWENIGAPVSRQHWSYEYMPGGRRSVPTHALFKRQHWSKGYSPGGKRSVDLAEFDDQGHRIMEHNGMKEKAFDIQQPQPSNGIHGPGMNQKKTDWKNWLSNNPATEDTIDQNQNDE